MAIYDVVLAGELYDVDPEDTVREVAMAEAAENAEADLVAREIAEDEHLEADYEDALQAEDYEYDGEPYEDDVWADADALASIGWGTDEDYGCYGGEDW